MPDNHGPNDKSNMEPAEGSRENVNPDPNDVNLGSATDSPMERGGGQVSQPEKPLPPSATGQQRKGGPEETGGGSAQPGAGVTNRPLEEERQNQEELPPRGERKAE